MVSQGEAWENWFSENSSVHLPVLEHPLATGKVEAKSIPLLVGQPQVAFEGVFELEGLGAVVVAVVEDTLV